MGLGFRVGGGAGGEGCGSPPYGAPLTLTLTLTLTHPLTVLLEPQGQHASTQMRCRLAPSLGPRTHLLAAAAPPLVVVVAAAAAAAVQGVAAVDGPLVSVSVACMAVTFGHRLEAEVGMAAAQVTVELIHVTLHLVRGRGKGRVRVRVRAHVALHFA